MSFIINIKLSSINSFYLLSFSLESLVKNLVKVNFMHLGQGFDSNVLNLVKQKGVHPYEYMSGFEKFKQDFPKKKKFYRSLTGKKIIDKEYEHVLKVWDKFGMKTMEDYHKLYLKCDVLL